MRLTVFIVGLALVFQSIGQSDQELDAFLKKFVSQLSADHIPEAGKLFKIQMKIDQVSTQGKSMATTYESIVSTSKKWVKTGQKEVFFDKGVLLTIDHESERVFVQNDNANIEAPVSDFFKGARIEQVVLEGTLHKLIYTMNPKQNTAITEVTYWVDWKAKRVVKSFAMLGNSASIRSIAVTYMNMDYDYQDKLFLKRDFLSELLSSQMTPQGVAQGYELIDLRKVKKQ